MRVDVEPIIERAHLLVAAISDKSRSRSRSAAHQLLVALPDPTWAETAPGCAIYYGDESILAPSVEVLRYSALTWLKALVHPDTDWEPTAAWPQPDNLIAAIRDLEGQGTQPELEPSEYADPKYDI